MVLSSIAFPAIGAGVARFAYEDVAVTMAEIIVEELRNSPDALSVTIYLFDRFGRMQPIDYVQFFEEFAVRTRLQNTVASKPAMTEQKAPEPVRESKRNPKVSAERSGVLAELTELDRERQSLEARLAEYGEALAPADLQKIKERLKQIQEKRIPLLSAVSPRPSGAISVFVSYAHEDEGLRNELGKHLSVIERQGLIATWHDRMIGAGTAWEGAIDSKLEEARVILLLISADFIASQYCYDVEMTRALERHNEGQALVIPIMLRKVFWEGTPFARLKVLPEDGKPVTKWRDRDSAFEDIVNGLRRKIQDLLSSA